MGHSFNSWKPPGPPSSTFHRPPGPPCPTPRLLSSLGVRLVGIVSKAPKLFGLPAGLGPWGALAEIRSKGSQVWASGPQPLSCTVTWGCWEHWKVAALIKVAFSLDDLPLLLSVTHRVGTPCLLRSPSSLHKLL